MSRFPPLLISAPGKLILFGEHAVVHGKTAIAASLGLRTYLFIEQRNDGIIEIKLPDVNIERSWSTSELPQNLPYVPKDNTHPTDMDPELKSTLYTLMQAQAPLTPTQEHSLLAFLYLYSCLHNSSYTTGGLTIIMYSALPVGAGLGSSASFSVALSAALLLFNGHVKMPQTKEQIEFKDAELINKWALEAEKIIHGNPSGIDNAVSTFGGAKLYTKPHGFSTLANFPALRLLLTNTRVPRSTQALVAGVGVRKKAYPTVIDPVLDAIQGVSDICRETFEKGTIDREAILTRLEDLFDINHALLIALGVSHPSLETVKAITAKYGMHTKLTGAGGGGCAVTLVRDGIDAGVVEKVKKDLMNEGFDCFETEVGVGGVAVGQWPQDEFKDKTLFTLNSAKDVKDWTYFS